MTDEGSVYRRLQQHLDEMPVGFPATESGVELRILQRLFSAEEAEAALLLSAVPERPARIARRGFRGDSGQLETLLDGMARKGLILRAGGRSRPKRYSKAPLAVGIYEMQVDRLTRELQDDFERYAGEAFSRAFLTGRTNQMRTIPLDARFVPERLVGRYDDARALLSGSAGPFAVQNCVCRQGRDLQNEPCRHTATRRVCLVIGQAAKAVLRSGHGEPVTTAQVMELLDQAEHEGLVLQPSNTQQPAFVCFCCGCCCGVLRMARQLPRPADYVQTNYRAAVDAELCAECGSCVERCPMEAVAPVDGTTQVDAARCIGCGVCVPTCSTGALRLTPRERTASPSRNLGTLYARIAVDRFGALGTARRVAKALLGRRV